MRQIKEAADRGLPLELGKYTRGEVKSHETAKSIITGLSQATEILLHNNVLGLCCVL